MNKKSHKKKKNRRRGNEDRNKENFEDDNQDLEDQITPQKQELCYEVKTSDVMGRYLVASREIRPGEVIIKAPALAVGPCAGCGLVCLGCYKELEEDALNKCKGCSWPVCSQNCRGIGRPTGHPLYECKLLQGLPPDYKDLEDLKESYHALMPLRCLLQKTNNPANWAAISAMEAHNELRRVRGDIWPQNQKHVVERLMKWKLGFDEEEVHTVCGILEVNAFEVGGSGANARALYDRAYLLAHSCLPSTTHTDAADDDCRPLTIRAAVHHKAGDLISLCYAYTLQGTLKRREHLLHSKFFSCACARCTDPTELGTFASAFCCPRCAARVLPRSPLENDNWDCTGCSYSMPHAAVEMLLKRLTDEFDSIDANDVDGFEGFLHRYRNVLHPAHYLCLSAKHSLSQLYGKVREHMIHEMPERALRRKADLCRDLMAVFDVLEPGYSRLRGVTLYELHAPLMILTTRDFEKKAISKDVLRTRLKEIVGCLSESAIILGFEPPQSPEGLMATAARDALRKIKTWEQIIGKIS